MHLRPQSGFHFTGTRNGIYIEALSRLGYPVKRNVKLPVQVFTAKQAETRNAKHPTRTERNGQGIRDTDKTDIEVSSIGERTKAERADMELFLQNAKNATVGQVVICPNCAEDFRKKTYNQCFCAKSCKDNYWNLVKPERLVAARGGTVST